MARGNDHVEVTRIISTTSAAATIVKKVAIPAGCYRVGVLVNSQLGAADTTVNIAPFADEAQTQATPGFMIESGDSNSIALNMPLASGPAGRMGRCVPSNAGAGVAMGDPVLFVPNGLQVTITKGGSGNADKCEVDLLLALVTTHAPLAPVVVT